MKFIQVVLVVLIKLIFIRNKCPKSLRLLETTDTEGGTFSFLYPKERRTALLSVTTEVPSAHWVRAIQKGEGLGFWVQTPGLHIELNEIMHQALAM